MKIYSIFYIFLLELANLDILIQNKSSELQSESKYKIKEI